METTTCIAMNPLHTEHSFKEPITCYVCGNKFPFVYRDLQAQDFYCKSCFPVVHSTTILLNHCVNNPQQFGLCHPKP